MENKGFKKILISRINPDKISPIHVNDMLVNHDGKEFFITFSEIEPPALFEEDDIQKLDSIDAIAKVKLVVSPEFAEVMLKTLGEGVEKFKLTKKENE